MSKERPYTRFHHDVEEALISARLNGTQLAIVLFVQRKTVGWDKEDGEQISLTEFEKATQYNRSNISDELKKLEKARILTRVKKANFTDSAKWKLNDKPKTWKLGVLVNRGTVGDKKTVGKDTTSTVPPSTTSTVPLLANHQEKDLEKDLEKGKSAGADPRFKPLIDFFHEDFKKYRGVVLDTDTSDYAAVKNLLKRQPEWDLKYLTDSVREFFRSTDKFHIGQGRPLRYWANNVNSFIPGKVPGYDPWAEPTFQ